MKHIMQHLKRLFTTLGILMMSGLYAFANEANLRIPDLHKGHFETLGGISAWDLLFYGAVVIAITLGFSLYMFFQIKKLPVHKSMADVSKIIYTTCCTYLKKQIGFLFRLFGCIAVAYAIFIFCTPSGEAHDGVVPPSKMATLIQVLLYAVIGMGGAARGTVSGSIRMPTPAPLSQHFVGSRGMLSISRSVPG